MSAAQFLDRAALARAGVFDGLGLVKNNDVPRRFLEPGQPNSHRVAGDDQVVAGQCSAGLWPRQRGFPAGSPTDAHRKPDSDGANFWISAFQLAMSEAGTISKLGAGNRRFSPPPVRARSANSKEMT